jgi:Uma2 family endonuclease
MALHDRPVRLTYDDYLLFPEDGRRHEILDGEHYVTPSPSTKHQDVSVQLTTHLNLFILEHRLGKLYSAPTDVVLSRHDVVVPDLVFISKARLALVTHPGVQGPPDLVIEILSPSTRRMDQRLKLERYESFGVQEYWVVDPDQETLTVYRLEGDRFHSSTDLTPEDTVTTPLLPGLELPLEKIFLRDED